MGGPIELLLDQIEREMRIYGELEIANDITGIYQTNAEFMRGFYGVQVSIVSLAAFVREVLCAPLGEQGSRLLDAWIAVVTFGGAFWPFRGICFASERPTAARPGDDPSLPVLEFRDG
jgi:hypothetical protein